MSFRNFIAMIIVIFLLKKTHIGYALSCKRILLVKGNIQKILNNAQPGDCVVIPPGKYFENIKTVRDGASEAFIQIIGLPGARILGEPVPGGRVVQIKHNYIILKGLEIDGHFSSKEKLEAYKDKLIYIEGNYKNLIHDIKIINNFLHNSWGECLRVKYARRISIYNNFISDCGLRDSRFNRGKKNGEAIYIGTAPEQTVITDISQEIEVRNNILLRVSECIDIKEGVSHVFMKGNYCSYTWDPNSGGISIRGNENIVTENLFYSLAGAGIRLGGDNKRDGIKNKIFNNLFLEGVETTLKIIRVPQSKICGNVALKPKVYLSSEAKKIYGEGKNFFKSCN